MGISIAGGSTKKVYYASEIGCVLDCILATGLNASGGVPTDNTAVINAFLAQATSTNPLTLILDGGTLISGLVVPAYVTIEGTGWNSGFYMKANTDVTPLLIGSASTTGYNVQLRNFQINGNSLNQTDTNACNIIFENITHLLMENIYSLNSAYFNTFFQTCNDVLVCGCRFESTALTQKNTDGVHLGGNCKFVRISDCYFRTNDDAIAVNAPESVITGGQGNISRVVVSNCIFDGCLSANRCYGWASATDEVTVDGVLFVNCVGTFQQLFTYECSLHIFGINTNGSKPVDTIKDFTGCGFTFSGALTPVVFGDPCGAMVFKNYKWMSPSVTNAMFSFWASNAQVSSLLIEGCSIYRNTSGSSAAFMLSAGAIAGSVIKKLTIRGFGVDDEQGQAYGQIPYLIDMLDLSIADLVIDALDSTNIAALVNPVTGFTGITKISGPGVLSAGFQIPDSVMANNTPYISATGVNAGLPCIKIGGTVCPYVFA